MYTYIHISLSLSLYIYIYIYVYTYVYVYIYIYIYVYTYIYGFTLGEPGPRGPPNHWGGRGAEDENFFHCLFVILFFCFSGGKPHSDTRESDDERKVQNHYQWAEDENFRPLIYANMQKCACVYIYIYIHIHIYVYVYVYAYTLYMYYSYMCIYIYI